MRRQTKSQESRFTRQRSLLLCAMLAVPVLHFILIYLLPANVRPLSFACCGLMPVLASVAALQRLRELPVHQRALWFWTALTMMLWAMGAVGDGLITEFAPHIHSDPAGFFYMAAGFPLMIAFSQQARTAINKSIILLNVIQIFLAFLMIWVRPIRYTLESNLNAALLNVYNLECFLLALFALIRLFTCNTQEERRHMRMLAVALWVYVMVEIGQDFLVFQFHQPDIATPLDLLWSLPFLIFGLLILYQPIDEPTRQLTTTTNRRRMFLEAISPMLITAGIFAIAASMIRQHLALSFVVMILLLLVQGTQSALVQMNYREVQEQLISHGEKLIDANSNLERLSFLDPLTGIANRRHFDQALENVWRQATRNQKEIAVLMIDLDYFKSVNDLHGHVYGDEMLKKVSQLLSKQACRPTDLLARYGGDELILRLPETDALGAVAVAERIQRAMNDANLVHQASPYEQRITLSIGIGVCLPTREQLPSCILQLADRALYATKNQGRNGYAICEQRSPLDAFELPDGTVSLSENTG